MFKIPSNFVPFDCPSSQYPRVPDDIETVSHILGHSKASTTLDIYGQVEQGQTEWFENLKKDFPEYINYYGLVDADKSVEVLQDYLVLLFPTRFYTEGIPGTIIDAYSAGVPVISAKWESFSDVVDDDITGLGYEFGNADELNNLLLQIANNPDIILDMKSNCIEKAKLYTPEKVLGNIAKNFGGGGINSTL